jgi:hypothetical protein
MTHVIRQIRHTGCTGFATITLPAMPTDPGAVPWEPPQRRKADPRAVTIAEECLAALRAAEAPMRSPAIARAIRRQQDSTNKALASLLLAGRVIRQREHPRGNAAYLWKLP